jgi:hypothetical protein
MVACRPRSTGAKRRGASLAREGLSLAIARRLHYHRDELGDDPKSNRRRVIHCSAGRSVDHADQRYIPAAIPGRNCQDLSPRSNIAAQLILPVCRATIQLRIAFPSQQYIFARTAKTRHLRQW